MPVIPHNKKEPVILVCAECGKDFGVPPYRKDTARFCSHACGSAFKRKTTGPSHPLYTRVERQCEWCGKAAMVKPAKLREFRFCSRACNGAHTSSLKPIGTIEKMLGDALTAQAVNHVARYPIESYCADFAFPERKIIVEADGDYWHASEVQKRKDAKRDAKLSSLGWKILRLGENDIHSDINECVEKIKSLLAA